ncbi:MAG TPA: gluconate:H+ symporter [Verrucomicrobiae bacterium]|nr:gluconate:H+ symporter [Verrucomicrobiae bacterium]
MVAPDSKLLLLFAVIAVAGLVVLIARFKLNAFLALVLASLFVGVCSGMDLVNVAKLFQEGVGATLGFVAVVVGLGTMLGKMLAESGGAEVVARAFVRWFGESRIHWTLVFVSFVIGLPVFFAVGLVLLVPILFALAKETKRPLLLLGIPVAAGLSASHTLVPPHPGPMIAIATLNADVGKTILYGIMVGVPAAILAGPVFGLFISKRVIAGDTTVVFRTSIAPKAPGAGITLFTILLPVLLMISSTAADLALPAQHAVRRWADFLGAPLTAMLIAVLFSFWSFGKGCGFNRSQILKFTEDCLAPAASIFLVVGAGGGFSRVLADSGTGKAIADLAQNFHMSPLLLGWLIAALIRVAVGSATVAISMAAGLIAPIAAATPGTNLELLVIAMGAGSFMLSHLNDGGFWFVKEYYNLTVPQTLKSWTVMETILSVASLIFVLILNKVF